MLSHGICTALIMCMAQLSNQALYVRRAPVSVPAIMLHSWGLGLAYEITAMKGCGGFCDTNHKL